MSELDNDKHFILLLTQIAGDVKAVKSGVERNHEDNRRLQREFERFQDSVHAASERTDKRLNALEQGRAKLAGMMVAGFVLAEGALILIGKKLGL